MAVKTEAAVAARTWRTMIALMLPRSDRYSAMVILRQAPDVKQIQMSFRRNSKARRDRQRSKAEAEPTLRPSV